MGGDVGAEPSVKVRELAGPLNGYQPPDSVAVSRAPAGI